MASDLAPTISSHFAITRIPVIASGGLSNNQDIEALCAVEEEGVMGVIAGRSIYAGDLDLTAAQKYADEMTLKYAKKIS